jgi:hypothetical protein
VIAVNFRGSIGQDSLWDNFFGPYNSAITLPCLTSPVGLLSRPGNRYEWWGTQSQERPRSRNEWKCKRRLIRLPHDLLLSFFLLTCAIRHRDAGQDHADRETSAVRRRDPNGGNGERGARRRSTRLPDWMRLEQQRGFSMTSSVMQFPLDDCIVNLLDTPGQEDFSELPTPSATDVRCRALERQNKCGAKRGMGIAAEIVFRTGMRE